MQKVALELLEDNSHVATMFINENAKYQLNKLAKKSFKAINLRLSFYDNGNDYVRGLKTAVWDMDVYKMPRIVKRLIKINK